MRKVYCPKHGENTKDIKVGINGEWSKPFCMQCIVEWLEKNICVCEIKEGFENGKETEKEN